MNKEVDDRGAEVGSCFVVQSLRDEDCFAKSKNVYTVTHILSKQNDQKLYTDVIYMDRASSRADLPAEVRRRMTPEAR